MSKRVFTSESVTEGHPDKICDQISDAVLDAILKDDPLARVACETVTTTGIIMIMGEISTTCYADVEAIARETLRGIGYDRAKYGFDCDTCAVLLSLHNQSPDIAMGVNRALEVRMGSQEEKEAIGAGDQGMMFGYACNETEELMPMPIALAHRLSYNLAKARKSRLLPYLRPDGKSQVTVEYENEIPKRISNIVVSAQHDPEVSQEQIRQDILQHVVAASIPAELLDDSTRYFINPTGRFVIGGPQGDSGLTGRKIIVDTYGGYAGHGGGCFSGKDPTKVDRSGAYMARYAAKNIVAAGLADICEIEISYAIGVSQPLSIFVNTHGTGVLSDEQLSKVIRESFDMRPAAIIEHLNLRRPIYKQVAAYGHFGRPDLDLPWEKTDKVEELRRYL